MNVETKEVPVVPAYKPFQFIVTIETAEEATWFHDHVLCKLENPNKNLDFKYDNLRRELIGTFFEQSFKSDNLDK